MSDDLNDLKNLMDGMIFCNRVLGFVNAPALIQRAVKNVQHVSVDVEQYRRKRDLLYKELIRIGYETVKPQGAFYFFPDVSKLFGKSCNGTSINNPTDLSLFLLNEAKVATVTGEAFGAPDCLRLSYATSEETMAEAISRIKMAIERLN